MIMKGLVPLVQEAAGGIPGWLGIVLVTCQVADTTHTSTFTLPLCTCSISMCISCMQPCSMCTDLPSYLLLCWFPTAG
jgi:hypothetical protein